MAIPNAARKPAANTNNQTKGLTKAEIKRSR